MPDPTGADPAALPFTGTDLDAVAARLGQPVGRWAAQRLGYVSMLASTGGLWRVTGPGWGCVAKWVRAAPAYAGGGMQGDPFDESSFTFWRREPDVYARGIADLLPAGVRMPELLGRVEHPDGVVLFLEDVHGRHGYDLTDEDLRGAARALGTAHGTALAHGATPAAGPPWATDALSEWVNARLGRREWLEDPEWDARPAFGTVPSARVREAARSLFARTPADLDLLAGMPVVLCHYDFWPANIVLPPEPAVSGVVLLDWAHTGPGAPGVDIGVMAATLIGDRYRPVDQFASLLDLLTDAYLSGMADAGWTHRPHDARIAAALAAPGRFLGYAAGLPRLAADDQLLAAICARAQWEPEEFLATTAEFVVILADIADRAMPRP
jgi:Phosphotransferase enzyme family